MDFKPDALNFSEDEFDLVSHQTSANQMTRQKARVKKIHRQIAVGKVFIAIVAIAMLLLILFLLSDYMVFI